MHEPIAAHAAELARIIATGADKAEAVASGTKAPDALFMPPA